MVKVRIEKNRLYTHANAPEMEVYPQRDLPGEGTLTEFWLPLKEKPGL